MCEWANFEQISFNTRFVPLGTLLLSAHETAVALMSPPFSSFFFIGCHEESFEMYWGFFLHQRSLLTALRLDCTVLRQDGLGFLEHLV